MARYRVTQSCTVCHEGYKPAYAGQPCPYCGVTVSAPPAPHKPQSFAPRVPTVKAPSRKRTRMQARAFLLRALQPPGGSHGQ
jgi:hypothetical protein